MALKLKVPSLEEKPLVLAQTQPAKVADFIALLPSNASEAASMLFDELEILNRQKVAGDNRFKLLETYRVKAIELCSRLSEDYCLPSLPLTPEAKRLAKIAESLWLEFSYGYKLALLEEKSQLFSLSGKKYTAICIQRAIDSIYKLMMVHYHTYFNVPASIWADAHQLYLYAVEQGVHQLELGEETVSTKPNSIDFSYKETLLMSLADPRHLNVNDINLVADYISRYAHHTQIQGMSSFDNPSGIFLLGLNKDKPPIPYVRSMKPADSEGDVLFITMNLARIVHQHILMLQTKVAPNKNELPENATDPRYLDLMVYLIKHWAASPKRIFGRKNKNNISDMVTGIKGVHYFINGEQSYSEPEALTNISDNPSIVNSNQKKNEQITPSRWHLLNISAGGLALRMFPQSSANIRIGDLIGLKNQNESNWSIGVVRWATVIEPNQLDVGAELIAPQAYPAGIRVPNRSNFEPVLILPPVSALKQASSIVASFGTYSPARVLELDQNGAISKVMITRLIERTGGFERFHYSSVDE